MVQMSLRILENLPKELPPRSNVILQKEFIFSDKPLLVSAKLDSGVYKQGEKIKLVLSIQRQDNFPHEVRKIKAAAIQQVILKVQFLHFYLLFNLGGGGGGFTREMDEMIMICSTLLGQLF